MYTSTASYTSNGTEDIATRNAAVVTVVRDGPCWKEFKGMSLE